jgi:hypothetical protein
MMRIHRGPRSHKRAAAPERKSMPTVFSGVRRAAFRGSFPRKAQHAHLGRHLTAPWKRSEGPPLAAPCTCPAPPCRATRPPGPGCRGLSTPLLPVSASRRLGESGAVGVDGERLRGRLVSSYTHRLDGAARRDRAAERRGLAWRATPSRRRRRLQGLGERGKLHASTRDLHTDEPRFSKVPSWLPQPLPGASCSRAAAPQPPALTAQRAQPACRAGPSVGRPKLPEVTRRRPTVTVEPRPPPAKPQVRAARPYGFPPRGSSPARWGVSAHCQISSCRTVSLG